MALRYAALAVGAFLVLSTGIYLFFEVRAQPAQAKPPSRAPAASAAKPPVKAIDAEEDEVPPPRGIPARTPPAGEPGSPPPAAPPVREPPRGPDGEAMDPAPQRLDAIMAEANKAYDRGDLDESRVIARKVLKQWPGNVRMLRIVVSASCIAGDLAEAQEAFVLLPNPDREQMRTRCTRYGATLKDP